jgi:hypothetical protein
MNVLFPIGLDRNKLLIIDNDKSFFTPGVSVISTPFTNPVLAITSESNTNPNFKSVYTFPLTPSQDLNYDPEVHDVVTSSIYRQTFEKWIYNSEFEDIFNYIKIVNGEPKLITNTKDKDRNFDNYSVEKKIRFIKDNILSRGRVKKILQEFVEGTRTNWYDIEKNTYYVKDLIYRYIKKKLKALVEKKERK